ncbi:MAG TPA: hypothetical protein VFH68_19550 [Polyangia bacterium]|nr:hypothetical protein [Polyangia bacterium]
MTSDERKSRARFLAALVVTLAFDLFGAAAAVAADTTPAPPAAPQLGRLEKESVNDALVDLGIQIEAHADGKIIRAIHVVNQEVFSRRDWWFRWFNIFHRTTRGDIIARELLVRAGQPYDAALVEESLRNLQATSSIVVGGSAFPAPDLSSVIVILPVVAPAQPPGTVDLLVVTRDVWSLRFNTNFEFQQNTLSLLETSLSENNLFGWRKYLSFGFSLDLGAVWTGPTYFDPNIAGTRATLYAAANAYYARDTGRHEGDTETLALVYPLYSLASRWGGSVELGHGNTVARKFRGTRPRLVNLIDLDADGFFPALQPVPYVYRRKVLTADANLVRQLRGARVVHRVTGGYRVDSRRSQVPGDFPALDLVPLFLRQIAPVSETRSEPYVQYDLFTPRYGIYRDLNTFDLRENVTLGPSLSARVAAGLPELGADFRAFPLGLALGWRVAPWGGLGTLSLAASARLRDRTFIDQSYSARLSFASPMLRRWLRVVVAFGVATIRNDSQRGIFELGGDSGLRGYAIRELIGTSDLLGHVELRTAPLAIFSQRLGSLLFYDVGDAAPSLSAIVPKHDVGIGLRWLIPQLNSTVIRIDWAFATQSTTLTRAGFPGRASAGFQQIF